MGEPSRIDKEALRALTEVMQRSAASGTAQITDESGAPPLMDGKEAPSMFTAFTAELDRLDEFSGQAVAARLMGFFEAVLSAPSELAPEHPKPRVMNGSSFVGGGRRCWRRRGSPNVE